jgi:hypothetical protein
MLLLSVVMILIFSVGLLQSASLAAAASGSSDSEGNPQASLSIPQTLAELKEWTDSFLSSEESRRDDSNLVLIEDVMTRSRQVAVLGGVYAVPIVPRITVAQVKHAMIFMINTTGAVEVIRRISNGDSGTGLLDAQAFNVTLLRGDQPYARQNEVAASIIVSNRQLKEAMQYFSTHCAPQGSPAPSADPRGIISRVKVTVEVDENGRESIQVDLLPPSSELSPFADSTFALCADAEAASTDCSRPRQLAQQWVSPITEEEEEEAFPVEDETTDNGPSQPLVMDLLTWLQFLAQERLRRIGRRPGDGSANHAGSGSGDERESSQTGINGKATGLEMPDCTSAPETILDSQCGSAIVEACTNFAASISQLLERTPGDTVDQIRQLCARLASAYAGSNGAHGQVDRHGDRRKDNLTWWL